jgi:hypothetical protein
MTARGQAYTLEAILAALVLIGSVAFALGATGVTPLSGTTASEEATDRLSGLVEGTLDAAAANGSLKPTVLYWNGSEERFHGADRAHYVSRAPPTAFGRLLARTLGDRSVAFNVNVYYVTAGGNRTVQPLVSHGTPGDDAVRATRAVGLSDDDRVRAADGTAGPTLTDAGGFYAPNAAPDGPVYNVVVVEVIAWHV